MQWVGLRWYWIGLFVFVVFIRVYRLRSVVDLVQAMEVWTGRGTQAVASAMKRSKRAREAGLMS
jgi:hypothetical protein